MLLPTLKRPQAGSRDLKTFYGYNATRSAAETEFYDMENLWSGEYPLLSTRPRRGTVTQLSNPQGMIAKDALLYVDDGKVFYNNYEIKNFSLSREGIKQIVSMGAYAVFFPDKKYINTADINDFGALEAVWIAGETAAAIPVSFSLCTINGEEYRDINASAGEPENPAGGDYWLDTSAETHVLKQWSESSGMWLTIPTVYTRIEAGGIGAQFGEYDGVTISGVAHPSDGAIAEQYAQLNGTKLIYKRGEDYIVVVGLVDQAYTQTDGAIRVSRDVPDMDYVCEAGNRLWGCKYGMVDGKAVNEIYCCKLGDFKNWNSFAGVSTDAWAASRGADGQFTGAITYQGHPIFFRERSIETVYPSDSGAHQVVTNECAGVQKGSWRSLAIVGDTLLYKSPDGVCAYTGSMPYSVSKNLGSAKYYNARAGAAKNRYYISMQDAADGWHLFCYDTEKTLWHREDALQVVDFAAADGDLFYQNEADPLLGCCLGGFGEKETDLPWRADFGLIGIGEYQRKYVTRISLRGRIEAGGQMKLYMQYDSSGVWEYKCTMNGQGLRSFLLPITPKRCDHVRMRIEGSGEAYIYAIHLTYEKGSDA